MSTAIQLKINQLLVARQAWPRFGLDEERAELFKDLLTSGEELPPVEVVPYEPDRYLIADGVHRVNAASRAGRTEIGVVIIGLEDGETPVARALRRGLETATKTALPLTTPERRQQQSSSRRHVPRCRTGRSPGLLASRTTQSIGGSGPHRRKAQTTRTMTTSPSSRIARRSLPMSPPVSW
jgi:hypothetical protein